MLQRISGGNGGIAKYLRTGLKQGREYTRQEMDKRVVLDGNLDITESIINRIEDKGQERYLHITLSFYENEISEDTLKNITQDYKDLLMNAYDSSEFNFYAEAHIPTLKNMVNNSTGELIERKPHIHIVIPEKNLLTGNHLNPRGKGEENLNYFDAIQEHLNKKYNLASPKDGLRVSDQNHANVLSRYKGDLFKERESSVKQDIFNAIDKNNIRSTSEFEAYLKNNFKEAKTYNAGKDNQYYGVKLENDSKFTRLKSPLFSKQYIENRTIPLIKPTEKQIQKGLENWKNKVSHEIKLIRPASEKLRKAYGGLNDNDKREAIQKIRENYNAKHGITKLPEAVHRGNPFRSSANSSGRISNIKPTSGQEVGLPHLQKCGLVHGLHDRNGNNTAKPASVLPSVQVSSVAEVRRAERSSSSVRWTQGNNRGGNLSADSSLFEAQKSHSKPSSEESLKMREIRDNINPDRFLSYCQDKFNIDASKHKVTLTESGSPRFNVGNRNMNASDFLTKHINLSWQDARDHLLALDKAQKESTYYAPVLERQPLTKTEAKERFTSLNSEIKNARDTYKTEIKNLYDNYSLQLKSSVNTGNKAEREAAKTLNQFYLERDKEAITQKFNHELTTIRDNHNNWISASHYEDVMNNIKNPNLKHEEIVSNKTHEEKIEVVKETSIQEQPKTEKNNLIITGSNKITTVHDSNETLSFSEKMALNRTKKSEFDEFVKEFSKENTDLNLQKQGGVTHCFDKNNREIFTDNGKEVLFKNVTEKDLATILEYSDKKFGGKLELTGTTKFKEQCANIAAEKGMNIILTPEKYHEIYKTRLAELQPQNQIKEPDPIIETRRSEQLDPAKSEAHTKQNEEINTSHSILNNMDQSPRTENLEQEIEIKPKITYKIPEVLVSGKDANQIVQNIKNEAEKMFQGTEIQISIEKEGGVELIGFDDDIKEMAINDMDKIINNELEKPSKNIEFTYDFDR